MISSSSVSIIIITIINILESAKHFVNLRTLAVVVSVSSYMFIILFTLKNSLVCYMYGIVICSCSLCLI